LDMRMIAPFENYLLQHSDVMAAFHETNVLNQNQKSTPVMFAISQTNIESDTRLLLTLINIEKRKKAEQAVIKLNESLEEQVEHRTQALRDAQAVMVQQSKAAALGQMAATVVHELSQPLSAMNSSITAAQLKVKKDDWTGAVRSISRLAPLSEKMNNVIKLLKYFSYEDGEDIQRQDLALLIKQSINLYQDKLKETKVSINLENLPSLVTVKINPLKLDLVLTNIIQNAIDAMQQCEQPIITIAMVSIYNKAIITIEDQGDGINSRVMGQLFDPYFTTKDIGKGLGLGLSICYEIIQEYHGSIVAENRLQGARFTITLPLDKD
jgi:two-component system C4-dicarboxylate transport sensor histidine kinase DctB